MVISMAGRRSRAAMKALKDEMRRLEVEGKSRVEISEILNCTKAQVTRNLGAVHQWRGKRLPADGGQLYRFFDAADVLLYVGISLSAVTRAAGHRAVKPWFFEVVRIEIQSYSSMELARAAELKAIALEKPKYNRGGVPRETLGKLVAA